MQSKTPARRRRAGVVHIPHTPHLTLIQYIHINSSIVFMFYTLAQRTGTLFVVLLLILLPLLSATAQAPEIPENIRVLLDKDPGALTEAEQAEILPYVEPSLPASPDAPEGTVNCFDYYTFGSVQVDLSPTLGQTVPGTTLIFKGTITNNNPYPLVNGQVYVKIFKTGGDATKVHQNGYALVDQFALPDTFILKANEAREASFTWNVPENAAGGEYMAAFFFQTEKRYNLLGLSFTDDVTGNQAHFTITNSDKTGVVSFDKNSVTFNKKPYSFAAFPPHFTKNEIVHTAVTVSNPKDEVMFTTVTWKLYSWDGLREETLKDTRTEVLKLAPGETRQVTYGAPPINGTVSYLVAELTDGASKSILDMRFVRDDIEEMRINFPSILSYPLKAGEESTVFSCIHSTNIPLIPGNTLTLTLTDEKGNVIHTYTYNGDVTGAMMGLKDTFVPEKTYSTFTLTATLEHKGSIFEKITIPYKCEDIDQSLCQESTQGQTNASPSVPLDTRMTYTLVFASGILSVLGALILYRKREKSLSESMHLPE